MNDVPPNFVASVDNITEEYGPLGKQFRDGISIWDYGIAHLLVDSPRSQTFPINRRLN